MRWEELLLQELDDLELQAEGLYLAERAVAVAELSVSAYADIDMAARLHASLGAEVQLSLKGGSTAEGPLTRAGRDWVLVGRGRAESVVPMTAILRMRGASERAIPAEARSLSAKLGLGSALRQLAHERETLAVALVDGSLVRGRIRRVGADFVELAAETGATELVPFSAIALLRRGL
ncbi:MAG TPA: hypothetical protein VLI04_11970 [Nocardioidaceae bacterium]|nr:hypothetical protein [Nocardioidaceae bacterium]